MKFAGIARPRPRHIKEGVAVLIVGREPYCQLIAQRDIHRGTDTNIIVVAVLSLDKAAEMIERWIGLGDENSAARGVLTGECPLRTAQHFNAGDVVIRF